jgi:hypothetical protein
VYVLPCLSSFKRNSGSGTLGTRNLIDWSDGDDKTSLPSRAMYLAIVHRALGELGARAEKDRTTLLHSSVLAHYLIAKRFNELSVPSPQHIPVRYHRWGTLGLFFGRKQTKQTSTCFLERMMMPLTVIFES